MTDNTIFDIQRFSDDDNELSRLKVLNEDTNEILTFISQSEIENTYPSYTYLHNNYLRFNIRKRI